MKLNDLSRLLDRLVEIHEAIRALHAADSFVGKCHALGVLNTEMHALRVTILGAAI